MKARFFALAILLVSSAFLAGWMGTPTTAVAQTKTAPAWEVSGLWSEACPCNWPCPCWYGQKPTFDHCENIQVFKIDKGHYGDVPLDAVVVVVAWVTPEGEVMSKSADRSKLFALYVDPSTTRAQRDAVDKIWRGSYFDGVKASRGEMRTATISSDIRRDYAKVAIAGILTYEAKGVKSNPPDLKRTILSNLRQGMSIALGYSDYGLKWDYPRKHAMFGDFQMQSSSGAGSK